MYKLIKVNKDSNYFRMKVIIESIPVEHVLAQPGMDVHETLKRLPKKSVSHHHLRTERNEAGSYPAYC
jgi:hypothetical protein